MKRPHVSISMLVLGVILGMGAGCQHNKGAVSAAAKAPTAKATNATEWEYKIDKMVGPVDLRKKTQEWQEQGWSVLSVSGPVLQPDGTTVRKAQLRREKRTATSSTTEWEYKTDEVWSSDELRQKFQEWSDQGWLVLSITSTKQPDGTTVRKAQLKREKK